MRRTLTHQETLVYYDGPELFVGRDQVGCLYLCSLVTVGDDSEKYLCVATSPERLATFRAGELDLRTVLESPETEEHFCAEINAETTEETVLCPLEASAISPDWFPEAGFFLSPELPTSVEVIAESRKRLRAVVHLRMNPPESRSESKITVDKLAEGASIFQRLLRHAYRKALQAVDPTTRSRINSPEFSTLEAFSMSGGSFTLHLQSSASADLFGYADLQRSFCILDEITEQVGDAEATVSLLRKHKGHLVSAYRDWLGFIKDNGTPIDYEWAMPHSSASVKRSISMEQARSLYEAVRGREDLGEEMLVLEGVVDKVDVPGGQWRLVSEEDGTAHHGKCDPESEVDLAGITVETQKYRFHCVEHMDRDMTTGRESRTILLRSYESVS